MNKRSKSIVPSILLALQTAPQFTCKITDLPASYQLQPYNLAAKIQARGDNIRVNIIVNRERNCVVIVRTNAPAHISA